MRLQAFLREVSHFGGMLAKTVLREINDEMEQLVGANQRGSAADRHSKSPIDQR